MTGFQFPQAPWPTPREDDQIILFSGRFLHQATAEGTWRRKDLPPHLTPAESWYIGTWEDRNVYTAEIAGPGNGIPPSYLLAESPDPDWVDLRGWFLNSPPDRIFLAGRGSQLRFFHKNHRYCGVCGEKTHLSPEDYARVCPECGHQVYPRLSPAVITLVHRGREILLGHNAKAPEGHFALFAGFVEAGESLEEAARREVREEAGVEIGDPVFHSSQNWPFPDALMAGFTAPYTGGEPKPDGVEITEVKWFSPENPPKTLLPGSIAKRIIDDFWKEVRP